MLISTLTLLTLAHAAPRTRPTEPPATQPWPDVNEPLRTGDRHRLDAALVIGNERYTQLTDAPYAERDAEAVYLWLLSTRGVPPEQMFRVESGSLDVMRDAARRAAASVKPGGVLWVYYSGHGVADETGAERLLLARDASPDFDAFDRTALPLHELEQRALASPASHTVFLLDTSFVGVGRYGEALFSETRVYAPSAPLMPERLTHWTAATADQYAHAVDGARHGLFTWALLGALRGWADGARGQEDDVLRLDEAQAWVHDLFDHFGVSPYQSPSRDLRSHVQALELTTGRLYPGPPFAELPSALAAISTDEAPDDPRALASLQAMVEMEREVAAQFQAKADAEWAETVRAASLGGVEGKLALRRFIDRFSSRSYGLAHRDVLLSALQVPLAEAMLRGDDPGPRVQLQPVQPGSFEMGSGEQRRTVTLTRPYAISLTEVDQRAWVDVMGHNPSAHRGLDRPVDSVSWDQAVAFCNALSALEGLTPAYELVDRQVTVHLDRDGYRLPTEAEWEHAAGGRAWSGGDAPDRLCQHANVLDTPDDALDASRATSAATCSDGEPLAAPVRRYLPNERGLYDLTGNLAEWVHDAWAPIDAVPATDPLVERFTRRRVLKGGSYLTGPDNARSAARAAEDAHVQRPDVGFRVVRTLTAPTATR